MKKALSIFLSLVMMLGIISGLNLTAYADMDESIFEYDILSDGTAEITGYIENFYYGDLCIESKIAGHKISSIKDYAFYGCSTLDSVSISQGIKSIGAYAFDGCYNLKNVSIANGVTSIGNCAFNNCTNLKSVTLPDTLTTIGEQAFAFCENLESIVLPDNAVNLGDSAFLYCTNLKEITLPSKLEVIPFGCFHCCLSLLNIKIPNSVKYINSQAFATGMSLTDIYYCGTEEEWNAINIEPENYVLDFATIHFHSWDDGVVTKPASYEEAGIKTYTCKDCNIVKTEEIEKLDNTPDLSNFIIKTVSVSLESSITMNFKVPKSAVAGFDNPYVVFNCEGDELTVTDYAEQEDYYVFSYPGISPQLMNDNVVAVLHGEYNGTDYASPKKAMSVRTYAYTMLDRYNSDDYTQLRTLLVDLLNYGAVSQRYSGYQTDNLVNADLTSEQKSWGTSTQPTFENIRDYNYKTIDNSTSNWVGSGLVLNNSVTVRAKFSADSIDNKTVVISCGKGTFTYSKDDFVQDKDGNYYVYCDKIFANEMSEEILLTVYENGVQCSNTMKFSIESYAKLVQDSYKGTALDELTTAMMRYGNSAKAYGA